ncbi:glycerate kinase [Paenibacillus spongiae]|uniref:Glycerate kinase n=1 Tax=Paenibacillus spongiae TaxID=2909671 RepID=A0ABY5S879_9BACL|nr:glycerate kinase [Paenibacillus spongiae]UVI30126.1 glycerate kinase [Paenibacillus spongiae]
MKIVIAPDSFKGSLSAVGVGSAIERGIKRAVPGSAIKVIPMADGGEGTVDCLVHATSGRIMQVPVSNPLGRVIEAGFGMLGDGTTCVIEMAMASGLYLIEAHERNPLHTTTYGVGQLIEAALDQGCRSFIIGVGGSATNDGGAGMLQALGVELLDGHGESVGFGGGELQRITAIRTDKLDPRIAECDIVIACDVDNPYVGPKGASAIFGPQKGATPLMVEVLDQGLRHFADLIESTLGIAIHDVPGTGAAGGLSGAIMAFLNGRLESGVSVVARVMELESAVSDADLVITGEGQVDYQTARGKTPYGVAQVAKKHHVPVVVLAGSIGEGIDSLYEHGISAVVSIVNRPMTLDAAMAKAESLLEEAAEQLIRIYQLK